MCVGPTHRREFGRLVEVPISKFISIVGNFHRADPVAIDVEQRLRIVVVTMNQIALRLKVQVRRWGHRRWGPVSGCSLVL